MIFRRKFKRTAEAGVTPPIVGRSPPRRRTWIAVATRHSRLYYPRSRVARRCTHGGSHAKTHRACRPFIGF